MNKTNGTIGLLLQNRDPVKKGLFPNMAFIQCNFPSAALGVQATMNVILPDRTAGQDSNPSIPTLLLLHGLSDDHSTWARRTSIERYVSTMNLAVIMPAVNRSFYANMEYGGAYWTFISEELPAVARSYFHLSNRREDNFVAGLSMGGYGAFKLALHHPERYAAAASLSGALDIDARRSVFEKDFIHIFGENAQLHGSEHDLFRLASELSNSSKAPQPKLYQACGTEDFLYEDNQRFLGHARKLGLDLVYEEESGTHNWGYWDLKIQRVLEWLPIVSK